MKMIKMLVIYLVLLAAVSRAEEGRKVYLESWKALPDELDELSKVLPPQMRLDFDEAILVIERSRLGGKRSGLDEQASDAAALNLINNKTPEEIILTGAILMIVQSYEIQKIKSFPIDTDPAKLSHENYLSWYEYTKMRSLGVDLCRRYAKSEPHKPIKAR